MKIRIPNSEVQELLAGKSVNYPKYSTQIMNLSNQNAQGTRPKIVGQMSELIQEFSGNTMKEWEAWYLEKHPDAINAATDKVMAMVESLKESIQKIDRNIVKAWVEELVIIKTFAGLKFQEAILKKIAEELKVAYRLANKHEESQGIDGYLNKKPVSIKASTYKVKMGLNENIQVPIIYYEKKKSEIVVEYEPSAFV